MTRPRTSVWKFFRYFEIFMKPFGMAAFTVNKNHKAESKIYHLIYFLFVIGIQIFGVVLNCKINMSMTNTKVKLIDTTAHFTEIFTSIIVLLGTLTYYISRHKMLEIFDKFDKFDNEVS